MSKNAKVTEIDALFEELDRDGGGSLDINELKVALVKLQQAALSNQSSAADVRQRVNRLRSRAAQATQVAQKMVDAQAAKRDLTQLEGDKSASAKLGYKLAKVGYKVHEVKPTAVGSKLKACGSLLLIFQVLHFHVHAVCMRAQQARCVRASVWTAREQMG